MTDHEGQESMEGARRPIIEVKNLRKEYPVLDEIAWRWNASISPFRKGDLLYSTANPVLANPLC